MCRRASKVDASETRMITLILREAGSIDKPRSCGTKKKPSRMRAGRNGSSERASVARRYRDNLRGIRVAAMPRKLPNFASFSPSEQRELIIRNEHSHGRPGHCWLLWIRAYVKNRQ